MKNSFEELFVLAESLKKAASGSADDAVDKPVSALEQAARNVGRSFSGSWQGYHSRVYYAGFATPPPGAHFSQEWGLMDTIGSLGSHGDWQECDADDVKNHIRALSGEPNLENAHAAAKHEDAFLWNLKDELGKIEALSTFEIADRLSPKGPIMTRDTIVLAQGTQIPPHMEIIAEAKAIRHTFAICDEAGKIATKAASHLERKARRTRAAERVGTNVFIGHGRSHVWRDLKDFLQDRLRLPWDEFNRVPVAGVTNIARLAEMLDAAAIAFLVMTAEDEMADGAYQARMNVVHEAGLFQGRLGFTRAVVMVEEGCEQFSNIDGLGQIRFPKGNISAAFEEVRRVLEREGLIESTV